MPTASERVQGLVQATRSPLHKVALDTNCVQYYLSNPPVQPWADCLDPIFQAAIEGKIEIYISTVVVSELLAHAHFASRHSTGYDPELDLMAIINRHFQVLEVNGEIAKAAGRLRGTHLPGGKISLTTPDALIGATSLSNNHTLFITNDAQLADAIPETNCIFLKEIAVDWLPLNFPRPCYNGQGQITPTKRGKGLPEGISTSDLEMGVIHPDPSARWKRILMDMFTVASAINQSCIFFVLTMKNGRKIETHEVLFWHESMAEKRPPKLIIKRLREYLGYSPTRGTATNIKNSIYGFVFASLTHERARQNQPGFASKSDLQKDEDAWNDYLSLWKIFGVCLDLPQTTWFLCENASTRCLNADETRNFLTQAKNVLGWNNS